MKTDYLKECMVTGNEIKFVINDFIVYITSQIVNEALAEESTLELDVGSAVFSLLVHSVKENKFIGFLFYTVSDAFYFANCYIPTCHNTFEIHNCYRNYCLSNDLILKKGFLS